MREEEGYTRVGERLKTVIPGVGEIKDCYTHGGKEGEGGIPMVGEMEREVYPGVYTLPTMVYTHPPPWYIHHPPRYT